MNKHIFCFLAAAVLATAQLVAQDTLFYNINLHLLTNSTGAEYFEINPLGKPVGKCARIYYKSGQLRSENHYQDMERRIYNGTQRFWYDNGKLKRSVAYKAGVIEGKHKTYWENGRKKRIDNYKKGTFKGGKCFDRNGKAIAYANYYVLPEFPGGQASMLAYVKDHFIYPATSINKGFSGKVIVRFVIGENGSVINPEIQQSLDPDIDKSALDFVKQMPAWKPAMEDGVPIRCEYFFPISIQ